MKKGHARTCVALREGESDSVNDRFGIDFVPGRDQQPAEVRRTGERLIVVEAVMTIHCDGVANYSAFEVVVAMATTVHSDVGGRRADDADEISVPVVRKG